MRRGPLAGRVCRLALAVWLGAASTASADSAGTADAPFLLGADVSMVPKHEELGTTWRTSRGPDDPLRILTDHGANCFRVRLFVDPAAVDGVVQDLPYVMRLARRIRAGEAVFLLAFHYSDTWADPGHQETPPAWRSLDLPGLVEKVEAYTTGVLEALWGAGCGPDIVQIGNEVTGGFLWPAGRLDGSPASWDRFAALLSAGIRGVEHTRNADHDVRVLIHVDAGGDADKTEWFFRNLEERNVSYDLIGLSYYPWWHGDLEALRENLHRTATRFGKDILIVETAYPWREHDKMASFAWPASPAGQSRFLQDVIRSVRATPDDRGRGVLWWYPEAVPISGLHVFRGGAAALFDSTGSSLPALAAFRLPPFRP